MNKKALERMLSLTDIKKPLNENKNRDLSSIELVKMAGNNKVYSIIKENSKYFIKVTDKTSNLNESDFDYIGGLANKPKYSYRSFEEASKNLNFIFEEINRTTNSSIVNVLESDDQLLDEKKFVLKLNKKKKKEPEMDFGDESDFGGEDTEGGDEFDFGSEGDSEGEDTEGGDEFDFGDEGDSEGEDTEGGDEFDFGDEGEEDTEGDEEFDFGDEEDTEGDEDMDFEDEDLGDSDDDIKDIQSTTGKLGQQLRDTEDLTSDMQKWVAKSVLSALDIETMDSDDKKDIIRTIKKKGEEPEEDMETGDEEFDFGGEEGMEESYDSYMDDSDDFDGMGSYQWDGEDVGMRDVDMGIKDKGYLNLDPTNTENPYDDYDSYMKDDFSESEFNEWMAEMEDLGFTSNRGSRYESYMDDTKDEDNPNIGGDEDLQGELLLDIEEDMSPEEMDALYGPNNRRPRYDRSEYSRSRRQADKDISQHYYDPAAPGYDSEPVEKWAKHKLPYDYSEFMGESREINEDHLNDEMETYEQEKAYEDVETVVRRYGMDVELCHKESNEDPEESIIYLDIVDGKKKLLKVRINSVGSIEVGEMKGKNFVGEPVDSVEDFHEIFGEDLTDKEIEDMDIKMMPQPQRAPEKQPNEPATKPGKPKPKDPSKRPSRRPFTPPPTITPGEEPGPKADYDDVEFE